MSALEQVSEFKYLGRVLDELGTDDAECHTKVAGTIRSLVNARGLEFECERVLHVRLLVPVLLYDSETMIWKEKVLGEWKVPNARIRELCGVAKGVDESVLSADPGMA